MAASEPDRPWACRSQEPAGLAQHPVQDLVDLVELGRAADQRGSQLDHRIAAVGGAAGQAGLELGLVNITPKSILTTIIGVLFIIFATLWLLRTRMGKASRAVADNPALASASGIDVQKVIRAVWILGAGLASYAGVIVTVNQGVSFLMGQDMLLLIFAAVTLGGLGTANGALVGSIIIGLFVQLSTLFIPTELKYVGALIVLILILIVRPQGILGRKERIG